MRTRGTVLAFLLWLLAAAWSPLHAQQFNSDSYLSKPHGMATIILTYGERNSMIMNTFSLWPRWEFTAAAFLYDPDRNPLTDNGYSGSLYAKYMFFENQAKTGGFAIKFGTGLDPGYMDAQNRINDAFRTYWMNVPVTLPFLGYRLSWDLMPGASYSSNLGAEGGSAWAFTYTTRLAWYPYSPKLSLVGEIVGSEGEGTSPNEYRVGPRWEPGPHVVVALTFDDEFHGDGGAGWEIGVMLFSPPFMCKGPCKP
jgi:hypothetical protein